MTDDLRDRAADVVGPLAAGYHSATAGPDPDADHRAWQQIELVPRVLQGLTSVSTATTVGGIEVSTPVVVAASAAHGLCHPDAERASAAGAARAGALFCYSSSATLEVGDFGSTATGPWWTQVYVMTDRGRTWDFVDRAAAAGTSALVLTVDNPGPLGDAPFRGGVQAALEMKPGNYPDWTWATMSASLEPNLTPDLIGALATRSGLPVWVKGLVHPADVDPVIEAGAAGIIVSNHGRRQLSGVISTARALPSVVEAAAGRVPVHVDGGIRSGTDVLRALTLGASAVGVGRPVLWALATGGPEAVTDLLADYTAELHRGLAGMGLPSTRTS